MLTFQCTVQILNRRAVSLGHNGKNKAVKGVISLKKLTSGEAHICISTNMNLQAHQFAVKSISSINHVYIDDGKLTIMMGDPPFNIMLRDADVKKLKKFVGEIRPLQPNRSLVSSGSTASENKMQQKLLQANTTESSKDPLQKRPIPEEVAASSDKNDEVQRTPSLLLKIKKNESSAIKRSLKTQPNVLKVKRKSDYPVSGFQSDLKEVFMNDVLLRKVDLRLLRLTNLTVLNLADNRINSIESLKLLQSRLKTLVLDNNRIGAIPDDLFIADSLSSLDHLSLVQNELVQVPSSLIRLKQLRVLLLSKNRLISLPYNMHLMRNLRTLSVDSNKLTFLPQPLMLLRLAKLDISENCLSKTHEKLQCEVKLDTSPTLLELVACFVADYNCRNSVKMLNVSPKELPSVVCDLIEACKYCKSCGYMASRYCIRLLKTRCNADAVITDAANPMYITTKCVFCEKCVNAQCSVVT